MKLGAALLALMLVPCATVTCGIAAAAPPAAPPATAPTAPTVPMAPRAPSAAAPTDTPVSRQPTLKACNTQADARNLTGKERATFVMECRAGRTPPQE